MLSLTLNRYLGITKNIEFSLSVRLLINFTALGGRGDGIKNASIGNTRFDVLGHKLVAVAGQPDTWVFRLVSRLIGGNTMGAIRTGFDRR